MKRFLKAIWPTGYFFLFFCGVLFVWVWVFKGIISHPPFPAFGGGAIIGALWAWFLVMMCRAVTDSGKELIKVLRDKEDADHA